MRRALTLIVAVAGLGFSGVRAQVTGDAPYGKPAAIINLGSTDGVALVGGPWRYSDAHFVEVEHRGPGTDLRPSGAPNRTNDITPHAGAAEFDDSSWPAFPAESIEARRGTGKFSFNWYRINVTVPERVGRLDPTGMTVVFELVVDDYAEVWVNGKLPVTLGQTGGQLVKGFNAPNRVVLTRDARPGQAVPARHLRHERAGLQSAGQLHLDPLGDARLLHSRAGAGRAGGARQDSSAAPCT